MLFDGQYNFAVSFRCNYNKERRWSNEWSRTDDGRASIYRRYVLVFPVIHILKDFVRPFTGMTFYRAKASEHRPDLIQD